MNRDLLLRSKINRVCRDIIKERDPLSKKKRHGQPNDDDENGEKDIKEEIPILFRLKRKAGIEPVEILAIDNEKPDLKAKKHLAKGIDELSAEISKLNISKPDMADESGNKEKEEISTKEKNLFEEMRKFAGVKETSEQSQNLVLRRINPSELSLSEIRNQYNKEFFKDQRDSILKEKRRALANDFKVYDISLKQDPNSNVLHCNNQPMIVRNLLEMATQKEDEESKYEYDYYLVKKGGIDLEPNYRVTLDHSARNVFALHFAEEEEPFYDGPEEENSDRDVDDYDPDAEDNPNNDYPDEEEDSYRSRSSYEDDNLFHADVDSDDPDREYHERQFATTFWSKIKDMSKF